jgi:hypothetical protein
LGRWRRPPSPAPISDAWSGALITFDAACQDQAWQAAKSALRAGVKLRAGQRRRGAGGRFVKRGGGASPCAGFIKRGGIPFPRGEACSGGAEERLLLVRLCYVFGCLFILAQKRERTFANKEKRRS